MYIYTHIYIYKPIYTYMYTCIYICICIYIYVYNTASSKVTGSFLMKGPEQHQPIYVNIHIYTYIYIHILDLHTHTPKYPYMYIYICVYLFRDIYIYIHIDIFVYACVYNICTHAHCYLNHGDISARDESIRPRFQKSDRRSPWHLSYNSIVLCSIPTCYSHDFHICLCLFLFLD